MMKGWVKENVLIAAARGLLLQYIAGAKPERSARSWLGHPSQSGEVNREVISYDKGRKA
jgi:hypothetical protein